MKGRTGSESSKGELRQRFIFKREEMNKRIASVLQYFETVSPPAFLPAEAGAEDLEILPSGLAFFSTVSVCCH